MRDEIEPDVEDAWGDAGQEAPTPVAAGTHPARPRTGSPARGGTTVPGPTAADISGHYAAHLSETSASAFMYFCTAGVFRDIDALAYKKYRDKLLVDSGNPTDPIEIMLIEQLALAHLNTGRLHFRSATADSLEAARTFGAIALVGEFRRGALALKAFRSRPAAAEARAPEVEVVGPDADAAREGVVGELGSNAGGDDHGERTIPLPESAAGRGWPEEPGEATRPKRRRA